MEDENYEHSPSGEVSDRSKKQCHVIKNLLTSLARDYTKDYCLTRTGNYKIHEFDWLKSILTAV